MFRLYSTSRGGFLAKGYPIHWSPIESSAYVCPKAEAEELATWHFAVGGVHDVRIERAGSASPSTSAAPAGEKRKR